MIWVAPAVNSENSLILLQLFAGFGWGLAFAGLMSFASAAAGGGCRRAVHGQLLAMTAVATVAVVLLARASRLRRWVTVATPCLQSVFHRRREHAVAGRRLPDRH